MPPEVTQVCLVTIYKSEVSEANKLMGDVFRFEFDLKAGKLIAQSFDGVQEFDAPDAMVWTEDRDALVLK